MQTCSEGSVFAFSSLGCNSKWMDLLPTLCCFSWTMRPSTYFHACLLSFLHACQLNCLLAYFPACIHLRTHLPLPTHSLSSMSCQFLVAFNMSAEFPLKHDLGRKVIQKQNDPIILEHFMQMPIQNLPKLIVDRESGGMFHMEQALSKISAPRFNPTSWTHFCQH